jgi:recombinational DNA repair ATPase RecF
VISSIRLQNYRNHKDTEIEFGELTALVGPNSAGKSNVLEAIRCFTRLSEGKAFSDIFSGSQDPDVVVRHGETSFALRLAGKKPVDWHINVKFVAGGYPVVINCPSPEIFSVDTPPERG